MILLPDKKAFSLTELLISSALLIVLLTTALGGFVLVKQIFAVNIAQAALQRSAAVIMGKIIRGDVLKDGTRLCEAEKVILPNDITPINILTFIGIDGVINRTYYLSNDSTSLLYSDTNGVQRVIYTVSKGTTMGVSFYLENKATPLWIGISVSVSQIINGRTVLGALKSSVYLRNHPA